MTEERKIIEFAEDAKMVAFSDKLLGMNDLVNELIRSRGYLYRTLLEYMIEKYGVSYDTHTIDCYELKLKPKIKGE